MPISPELGAVLAKLLADVGTTFAADNPQQQALSRVLSDRAGGLIRAQAFNRGQTLTQSALRQPGVGPGLPATAANVQAGGALVAPGIGPGITTAAGTVTPQAAGAPGVAPPAQIDPFQALALGQEGTQELIRIRQQDKFLVQRGLDRQQDFANRLKLIQQTRKNQQELRDLQNQFEAERDIERGEPEKRADEAFLRGIDVREAERIEAGAATPEQLRAGVTAELSEAEAQAASAESKARFDEATEEARIELESRKGDPSVGQIATAQRIAMQQVAIGVERAMLADLQAGGETTDAQLNSLRQAAKELAGATEGFVDVKFQALMANIPEKFIKGIQEQLLAVSEGVLNRQNPNVILPAGTQPRSVRQADIQTFSSADALAGLDATIINPEDLLQ